MKIYISGQITGLAKEVYEKNFSVAEQSLFLQGWDVVNPVTHCARLPENTSWKDYMIEDIRILFDCDSVYMLNNWANSRGARIEHFIAIELNKSIIYQL